MKVYVSDDYPGTNFEMMQTPEGDVYVAPQGGGPAKKYTKEEFLAKFREVGLDLTLRPGTVTADFLPDGMVLPCYSDGTRWNGWGKPWFDLQTAIRVVKELPDWLEYDEVNDEVRLLDEGENMWFPCDTRMHDDGKTKLYEIGMSNWCWDAVEFKS